MYVCVVCLGGLAAVIYTDVLQTLIMVVGSFALMFIGRVHYHMHTVYTYGQYWFQHAGETVFIGAYWIIFNPLYGFVF